MEQVSLWEEEEEKRQDSPSEDPKNDRKESFSQQNKNLRLLSPIYRIEQSKGKLGDRTESAEIDNPLSKNIDTVYLSILTLEYYASYALSQDSTPASHVIDYLLNKVQLMDTSLTHMDSLRIAEWVHNSLCNQADGYKSFSFPYYDALKQKMQRYHFRLIRIVKVDNGNHCKITEEGISALLTYITADPKLQEEITALLTQRLITAGRYKEALQMAERSRKEVIQYGERIRTKSEEARSTPEAGKITATVLPIFNEASQHITTRITEEDQTLANINDLHPEKLNNETNKLIIQLKQAITENLLAYHKLYEHIDETHKNFDSTFRNLLRPSTHSFPNMVNDLLTPICQWPVPLLSAHADHICNKIMPAKKPKLFDVISLLDKLDSAGEHQANEVAEQHEEQIESITRLAPLFTEKMIEACKSYYQQKIKEKQQITLHQLLIETEKAYFSLEFQHCLSYVVIMSFMDNQSIQTQSLDIYITKLAPFQHHFITGDNLLIEKQGTQHNAL
ncbi:MAG: hypothetical protein GQ583_08410 [Methyloprofundus sp.]|nr:hypothetical protein [Methyloprofundus sp.]